MLKFRLVIFFTLFFCGSNVNAGFDECTDVCVEDQARCEEKCSDDGKKLGCFLGCKEKSNQCFKKCEPGKESDTDDASTDKSSEPKSFLEFLFDN